MRMTSVPIVARPPGEAQNGRGCDVRSCDSLGLGLGSGCSNFELEVAGPASPTATPFVETDGNPAMPGPIRALHVCALAPVTYVKTAAAETDPMTPRHCGGP